MGSPTLTIRLFGLQLLPASARNPRLIAAVCDRAITRGSAASKGRRGAADRGELNIIFVDRRRMLSLNRRYLRHGHDTDVIAFPYASPRSPGPRVGEGLPFGDIFISAAQARRQAREMGHPVLTEVLTLALHGTLHLLGYDDSTPCQRAVMFRLQDRLLGPRDNAWNRRLQEPSARGRVSHGKKTQAA